MKEHKGQNTSLWRLFLGFGYVLTGVLTDRLNLFLSLDRLLPSFGLEPCSNA